MCVSWSFLIHSHFPFLSKGSDILARRSCLFLSCHHMNMLELVLLGRGTQQYNLLPPAWISDTGTLFQSVCVILCRYTGVTALRSAHLMTRRSFGASRSIWSPGVPPAGTRSWWRAPPWGLTPWPRSTAATWMNSPPSASIGKLRFSSNAVTRTLELVPLLLKLVPRYLQLVQNPASRWCLPSTLCHCPFTVLC